MDTSCGSLRSLLADHSTNLWDIRSHPVSRQGTDLRPRKIHRDIQPAVMRPGQDVLQRWRVGLLHACGGLCGCLRLQDEHEAPEEEDQQHEWCKSEPEEAKYQVAEPENEPAHVSGLSSA